MPRVVIEEFVPDDCECEEVGAPHKVMTHHEIDDFSKLDSKGDAMHFGLHEVSPLDGR